MFILFGIVVIIVSIFLTLIVLIQNPKGGVLSSTFGSMGNQILGANRSTDVVEKITWYLAGGLMVLSVASLFLMPSNAPTNAAAPEKQKSEIEEALKNSKSTSSLPSTSVPVNTAPQQGAPTNTSQENGQPTNPAPPAKK